TRTRTLSPRAACSASAATASTSRSARRARRQTASPAGVRRTGARPPGRWNSVWPSAASSAETCCDRADCVKPSAAAAARNDPRGRVVRPPIGALILVSAAAPFALVAVMPVYARRLGLSGFEQGMVLAATGLATLVVSVPAGTLSERFGARRITLAAGLLM